MHNFLFQSVEIKSANEQFLIKNLRNYVNSISKILKLNNWQMQIILNCTHAK